MKTFLYKVSLDDNSELLIEVSGKRKTAHGILVDHLATLEYRWTRIELVRVSPQLPKIPPKSGGKSFRFPILALKGGVFRE